MKGEWHRGTDGRREYCIACTHNEKSGDVERRKGVEGKGRERIRKKGYEEKKRGKDQRGS